MAAENAAKPAHPAAAAFIPASVCVHGCVRMCVCACVRACVCVCAHVCVCVSGVYHKILEHTCSRDTLSLVQSPGGIERPGTRLAHRSVLEYTHLSVQWLHL